MELERYDALAARLEPLAAERPVLYRRLVSLIAWIGELLPVALIVAALGSLALVVWLVSSIGGGGILIVKIGLPLLVLVWVVLRSLWVRVPPPEGVRVTVDEAPELCRAVERVRRAVDAPQADVVLVDDDFNASVTEVPRWGPLGPRRRYLVVGLPLLRLLAPDEAEAVLAHEFAHFSAAHPRSTLRIYRAGRRCAQVADALSAAEQGGASAVARIFRWYLPRFHAWSSVLSRRHELEADRLAATHVGPPVMARALLALELRGRLMERFWNGVWREADEHHEPSSGPLSRLLADGADDVPPDEASRWATAVLARETEAADSHPALRDRLGALVGTPDLSLRADTPAESAADALLGAHAGRVAEALDGRWWEVAKAPWRGRREDVIKTAARLEELDEVEARDDQDERTEWERIACLRVLGRLDEAVGCLRARLERRPDDADAHHLLGVLLLDRDDETGAAHLERAVELAPHLASDVSASLYAFHLSRGDADDVRAWRRRGAEEEERLAEAAAERGELVPRDVLLPHGASDDTLDGVRAVLARHRDVRRAWLIRKQVRLFPERPAWVLAVSVRNVVGMSSLSRARDVVGTVVDEVGEPLADGDVLVVSMEHLPRRLRRRIRRTPDAEVYRRVRRAVARAA